MKIVFLIGTDSPATLASIAAVCRVAGVTPVGLLLDIGRESVPRRLRSLKRGIRREGPSYLLHRLAELLADWLDRRAARITPADRASALLRDAFPDRPRTLDDLATAFSFPLIRVTNLNSTEAVDLIRDLQADLGVVLGTRVLRRSTFSVPRLGCINLHKGEVPQYRGLPPGFWELFDNRPYAGLTVHVVDDGIDTGGIIGTARVLIHENDYELSLRTKLDHAGASLLAQCIALVIHEGLQPKPQLERATRPRTHPTRRQREELRRRRPKGPAPRSSRMMILKTLFYLTLFYSGIYHLHRAFSRLGRRSRAAILLYHRVNDYSIDVLTTDTRRFAEHLAILERRFCVRSTPWLLDRLAHGDAIPPDTVIIHFDDCYRDVSTHAAPLLRTAGLPATAFIASGFIGTQRQFAHDLAKSPFTFENLTVDEIRSIRDLGFDIGAHTVNHVDLGRLALPEMKREVLESRQQLMTILQSPVDLFSFPFGRIQNIRDEARTFIERAGFSALFSAHGGHATASSDFFDLPRMGVSSEHRCLDLIMELEGLSISAVKAWFLKQDD